MNKWEKPLKVKTYVPIDSHPGSFGVIRKHDTHFGVDLYCQDRTEVFAVEDGVVINIQPFTGEKVESPWWRATFAVYVKGNTGIVCYGEIHEEINVSIGQSIFAGDKIGMVKQVLPDHKLRKDIPMHSCSMLHMQIYKTFPKPWDIEKMDNMIDPTSYLLETGIPLLCVDGRPNILLGVTGSVAAILTRKMIDSLNSLGNIRVVSTESGKYFIPEKVAMYTDYDEWYVEHSDSLKDKKWKQKGDPVVHIELRDWADVIVIAPLTANTLAKIANGISDNLLTSIVRASEYKNLIIAPAMNTMMWKNPMTAKHLTILKDLGATVVDPISKVLACGDDGEGAMARIETIHDVVQKFILH